MVIWFRFLMREDPPCSEFVRKRKGLHNNNSVIQSFSHSVIQSFSHSVIQSFSHSVIQSFSHSFLSKHNSFRLVNTQIVNNSFGSTLVTALIVTALIGFSFTAIVSQMINQQKEGRSIQQQMAVATLKYQVLQTLQNKDKCSCQFTQNIKSQTSEDHLTDFSTLRNSCNSDSEIIIEDGRFLGSGVNVGSIKVSDVSKIPGSSVEYSGKLIVPLKGNLVRAIRPIEIPMYFVSDSSGQIQECGANEGHTAEIREERRRLMADLDTQDQEIKDLTETFNTHRHQHTHPFHRHFTPPPIILASNNNGGSSGGGGDNDKPPDRRPSNSDGGVTFFNNGGSSGGGPIAQRNPLSPTPRYTPPTLAPPRWTTYTPTPTVPTESQTRVGIPASCRCFDTFYKVITINGKSKKVVSFDFRKAWGHNLPKESCKSIYDGPKILATCSWS